MSIKRNLIYIDGKDETERVEKYYYEKDKCVIIFKNNSKKF